MEDLIHRALSRRAFLQGTAAALGAVGLSRLSGGVFGCVPAHTQLLYGSEMVGKVTPSTSTIQLVGGNMCTPSTRFRLLYDTQPRVNPTGYAFFTNEISGCGTQDGITFDLENLSPGSRYYYRVAYDQGSGWIYRNEYSFVTRRPPGQGFRFCIATDMHVSPVDLPIPGRDLVFANILADRPDLLFTLGDDIFLAYQTRLPYPWSGQHVIWDTVMKTRQILDKACHSMAYIPVNGNHEGLFGWTAHRGEYQDIFEAKLTYFPVSDNATFPEGGDGVGRYGAFQWGDALFIWLDVVGFCTEDPYVNGRDNSKYILGNEQRTFLENTLAEYASVPWKFVFAHHLFGGYDPCALGYGRGNANGAFLYDQSVVHGLMVEYGVQAFFYGHDHVLSLSDADNIQYVCSGHTASSSGWVGMLESCYQPFSYFGMNGAGNPISGHVSVDVASDSVTISFIKQAFGTDNRTVLYSRTLTL